MGDPLDELRKRLYKQDESFEKRLKRPSFAPAHENAPPYWKKETGPQMPKPKKPPFYMSWKFTGLLAALIVVVVAGLYFWSSLRGVSERNVEVAILAPDRVEGGEKVTWQVSIRNRNSQALEASEINFEYPVGAKPIAENARSLREKKDLGTIGAGETVNVSFEAFLFGFEGEEKTAKAELEYQPANSAAILAKSAEFKTSILRSPIGVAIEMPLVLRTGQEFEMKISYISNAKGVVENLFLQLDHPVGFVYKSASRDPEDNGTLWEIGRLKPGDKGELVVKGTLSGSDQEQRSFNASVVSKEGENFHVYGGGTYTVTLRRPFLEVAIVPSEGGGGEIIGVPGQIIPIEVRFKNNLPIVARNVTVEVQIEGKGVDERRIRALGGDFRASDKKAIWTASTQAALQELATAEEGTLRLEFAFLNPPLIRSTSDKNFSAKLHARIFPEETPPEFEGVDVTGDDVLEIKLASDAQIVRKGYFYSTVIPNTGPLPPRVGQETTFTVVWSLTNSSNDVGGTVVKAPLPSYMNWKGVARPADANISYNQGTGEIIWDIGELKAGTGFVRPAREVAFQVGLVAGADLAGTAPELIGKVSVAGTDLYVQKSISLEIENLTLNLYDDEKLGPDQRKVVP